MDPRCDWCVLDSGRRRCRVGRVAARGVVVSSAFTYDATVVASVEGHEFWATDATTGLIIGERGAPLSPSLRLEARLRRFSREVLPQKRHRALRRYLEAKVMSSFLVGRLIPLLLRIGRGIRC